MSRIGKKPISLPEGVEVKLNGRHIQVKGKLGELSWDVPFNVECKVEEKEITFTPMKENKETRALWGLSRAYVANMVEGVSKGFEKQLEIRGVGFRANVQGTTLNLSLGFSHPVEMEIPSDLKTTVEKNTMITITGADKQRVGQFAADIRKWRKPEPYKGKGIRYVGERVMMKEGKKK